MTTEDLPPAPADNRVPGRRMRLTEFVSFLTNNPNSTQLFMFGFLLVSMWTAERVIWAQSTAVKLRHTGFNALLLTGVLPIQLSLMVLCLALAQWVTTHHVGLLYLFPNPDNPWLKYGAMFLALDFLDYVYHRTAHGVGIFWRLHLVHHTDQAVDVSTTFREHPAETIVRVSFLMTWVLLCGASIEALVLRQSVETFANVLQHTQFRLPPRAARALGWIFVTPNLHHIHHHYRRPGTNCNYGDVFSIWDRMLGTYVVLEEEDPVFGLDSHMDAGASTDMWHLLGVRRWMSRAER